MTIVLVSQTDPYLVTFQTKGDFLSGGTSTNVYGTRGLENSKRQLLYKEAKTATTTT